MAKIKYRSIRFTPERLRLIQIINGIIETYVAAGFSLTVRQIYYQLVAHGHIPNNGKSYGKIQSLINDARLAGEIDWDAVVDRTRGLRANPHYDHPRTYMQAAREEFQNWKWEDQPNYVEVWVEKDALVDILSKVCGPLDVPYFSCRGYTSVSEVHAAAMRFQYEAERGKTIRVIHLGDHDPSGIDMTRDIKERINNVFGVPMHIYRIALNMDQIDKYNPPPNPVKFSDSRAEKYEEEHGESSWELDALEPTVLTRMIEANIVHWRDDEKWQVALAKEKRAKHLLGVIHDRWQEVVKTLQAPPRERDEEEEE